MANSQRDNLRLSKNSLKLYFFPEISCDEKNISSVPENEKKFVRGVTGKEIAVFPPAEDSNEPRSDEHEFQASFNKGLDRGRNEGLASHREKLLTWQRWP